MNVAVMTHQPPVVQNLRTPAFAGFLISFLLLLASVWVADGRLAAWLTTIVLGALALIGGGDRVRIAPVSFVAFAYFLAFPVVYIGPYWLYDGIWSVVPEAAIADSMVWAYRGCAALGTGYFAVLLLAGHRQTQRDIQLAAAKAVYDQRKFLGLFAIVLGVVSLIGWVLALRTTGLRMTFGATVAANSEVDADSLGQIWYVLVQLRLPFFALAFALWQQNQASRGLALTFIAVMLLYLFDVAILGSKGEIMRGVVAFVVAASVVGFRWSRRAIGGIFIAVLVVSASFAVIGEYRNAINAEERFGTGEISLSSQIAAFATALTTSAGLKSSESDVFVDKSQTQVMFERYAAPTYSLGNLLEHTRGVSPRENYWQTFLAPVYAFMPRFLAPDKPIYFNSGRNGLEYYNLSGTGISVTLIGSLYFSLDYSGIIFGMLLVGALYGALCVLVERYGFAKPLWFILLIAVTIALLDVGGTFHALLTNLTRFWLIVGSVSLGVREWVRHSSNRRTLGHI